MKKIFSILVLFGLIVSCTNDLAETQISEDTSARAGWRLINGDLEITNSLGAPTRFNLDIASVEFVGEGISSIIEENYVNTDFAVASNVSSTFNQQFIGPDYSLLLISSGIDRIDLNINSLFTGSASSIDNDVIFTVRADIGGNRDSGTIASAALQTGPKNYEPFTLSVDMTGAPEQDIYYIYLYIDASYGEVPTPGPDPETMIVSVDLKLTNNEFLDFQQYGVSLSSVEFIGADYSEKLNNGSLIATPVLRTGEIFETSFYTDEELNYVDSPSSVNIGFAYIQEIDNNTIGFEVTATVKDGDGNLLGGTTVSFEKYHVDPDYVITVDLTGTSGVDEYFIYLDAKVVPQNLVSTYISINLLVNNINEMELGYDFTFEGMLVGFDAHYYYIHTVPIYKVAPLYGVLEGTAWGIVPYYGYIWDLYPYYLTYPELQHITLIDFTLKCAATILSGSVTLKGDNGTILGERSLDSYGYYNFDVSNYPLQRFYTFDFEYTIE
ncbi:MAG: hypothetical protein LIO79_03360 [Rikenellaceae bacterium]|nr:hypothetical protein [Rikenellaceae bacterium]